MQPNEESSDKPGGRPIKIAFVVEDIQAAIAFYTRIFDLKVDAIYPSEAGESEPFVFLKSQTIFIELLPRGAMGGAAPGFHHLAFWSDDVSAQLKQLRNKGAKTLTGAYPAGVGNITLADIGGPEGVLLRLFHQPETDRRP